jgi:hypothetical protein
VSEDAAEALEVVAAWATSEDSIVAMPEVFDTVWRTAYEITGVCDAPVEDGAAADAPVEGSGPGDVGAGAGTVGAAGADCMTGCGAATLVTLGAAASAPANAPAAVCAAERFFAGLLAGAE